MKISIITVCYKSVVTLPDTIKSICSQSYTEIEYIIIDGDSKDGTQQVASEYKNIINIFVSEKDRGIYDAMNKGLSLATGDIIGLLNADDFYADCDVLQKVMETFSDSTIDACYSDLQYVDQVDTSKIVRYWKSEPYQKGLFERGWIPPHPTFFVRKKIYEQYGKFNLSFKIAADVELLTRFIVKYEIKCKYLPILSVKMRMGGTSNKSISNIIKQNLEILRALKMNGLKVSVLFPLYKLINRIPQFFHR